jgi:four helix bundle protein
MASQSYRDLLVWQKAMSLVEGVYKLTRNFPTSEEFGLKSQMRRAAVSIPSNIAEGQGRHRPRVFKEYLNIAMGSLSELETQVELSVRLHIVSSEECQAVQSHCKEVGKMIYGLGHSLSEGHN